MKMDYIEVYDFVKNIEKDSRFKHSIGVSETAASLAKRFNLNVENARISGLYHDAYRYSNNSKDIDYCKEKGIKLFKEEKNNLTLLHAPLAAAKMRENLGDVDLECIKAVRYHTLGSKDMGKLGASIYVADYIEPGRKHLTNEDRKEILDKESLEDMVKFILEMKRNYFKKEGLKEAEVTSELYSYLDNGGKFD